jgi:hypothetical protein
MTHQTKPRPQRQLAEENARHHERRNAAGIINTFVMVPADRLSQIRSIALASRQEAKLPLKSDHPRLTDPSDPRNQPHDG